MNIQNKAAQWEKKQTEALVGGGTDKIDRQHTAGKKTARERLSLLLDFNSFQEIDQLATSPFTSPSTLPSYTDGVITGFGKINGKQVAVYAQDFTVKGGSLGLRHAEKIVKIMDMAAKIGCPIIGVIDSGGARIEEGVHALTGYGKIFMRNSRYSGIVPQISIILGPCAGGAVYSPALTDFIFMTNDISQMFITGPQVIAQVAHEIITKEALGGSSVHAHTSGVAHIVTQTEETCFKKVKELLSYLPSNYLTEQQTVSYNHSSTNAIASLVPENESKSYDIRLVIKALCDNESFFELQAAFAANIITCFARLGGTTVGIVANQPLVKGGAIDIDASCKAARFIRCCDSFDIPIISLVDVPGYLPGVQQEHQGIIRHGAKLLYAYATATAPKITVILRKAFGGAFIAMGSKELGADFNFAWPQAQIAVLGAQGAVSILHGKELSKVPEPERRELQKTYEATFTSDYLNPFTAAEWGYIDAIIAPDETRTHLIRALEITRQKVEQLPKRKHGNMPL
ncbi:MAG: acyl-CoA carboxylase subunit beta [Candidatus Babeliales bacterium]